MKDHEFRELVNTLRDIALQYHDHESLRERIRHALIDAMNRREPVAYKHRDEVLRLVREAGFVLDGRNWVCAAPVFAFERLAALFKAAEREACANLCEDDDHDCETGKTCAAAIRSMDIE